MCVYFKVNPVGLCRGRPSWHEILNYENGLKYTPFARDSAYLEPARLPVSERYIIQNVYIYMCVCGPHICGLHAL